MSTYINIRFPNFYKYIVTMDIVLEFCIHIVTREIENEKYSTLKEYCYS